MNEVFCDFVGVTFDRSNWPDVRRAIQPCLDTIGAQVEQDDDGVATLWRAGDGTVKAKRYGPVMSLGASGAVCAALRFANVFGNYLAAIASAPHTVTRLDASLDVAQDTPAVIDALVAKSVTMEGLSLTRKRVHPRDVTRLVARRHDGLDTGTCYVGSRNAEVRACVYDKQEERLSRGLPDIGPLTRYELRLKSGVGVTLRDVWEPERVFWNFMSPGIFATQPNVEPWVSDALGFQVDWPELPLPAERLRRRVQASADAFALVRLADEVGPYGFAFLVSELRKLQGSHDGVKGLAPSDTASNVH